MILDWNEYIDKAREVVSEGIVCLENKNDVLPLKGTISVFGRMQNHYYKSGTGSGGLVNAPKVWGILDGLREKGAALNEELIEVYKKWEAENPVKSTEKGWGGEPWSQAEMPLSDDVAANAAKKSDVALCIIARTAGEEQENTREQGSYFLTDAEEAMLAAVRKAFDKMVVVLNVGNLIDMAFVRKYSPDGVLYVWHGGMTGGLGTADVLLGKSPSGKMPDTVPVSLDKVPSDKNFGDPDKAYYKEDIYIGYRYYETFAKEDVLYPFGYGLSYTTFDIKATAKRTEGGFTVHADVTNTGSVKGKEVVQVYIKAPSGKLGKAARVLCGFEKTAELSPAKTQSMDIAVDEYSFASYDDCGKTEYPFAYVLESGTYEIYAGSDVRSAVKCGSFDIDSTKCLQQLSQALAPYESFDRIVEKDGKITYEQVNTQKVSEEVRRAADLPADIPYSGDKGYKFADIGKKCDMNEFIAQLTDEDLCMVARGEGIGSPKVTPGTTSAFGGMSEHLNKDMGVPIGCTADGPSGLRFDCGTQAFSLPIGTLIASTFNRKLATELYRYTGLELIYNKVECILGPGMNTHRHPLGGRNFEYFSEDPFLSGNMASAELDGLHSRGVTGTIKHFTANDQETGRHTVDSVVSERALREIYLKGFEIAIKKGKAKTVMTTYGKVNGLYTAGNYDLCTTILRKEWGFDGFVMTDWWSKINRRGEEHRYGYDLAQMCRAQNDIYMCVGNAETNEDSLPESLADGYITRAELVRNAENVFRFLYDSNAFRRTIGTAETVEITNRTETDAPTAENLRYYDLDEECEIDVTDICSAGSTANYFVLNTPKPAAYEMVMEACAPADGNSLTQYSASVFNLGAFCGMFTYTGNDKEVTARSCKLFCFSRYTTIKLYFSLGGLQIKRIYFKKTDGPIS